MDVTVTISTPVGEVNLNTAPYRIAGDSFGSEQVSHRKTEASNPYVEGTFVVNTVRENVGTTLSMWVTAKTRKELLQALQTVTSALDQAYFTVTVSIDDATVLWNCITSDYTIEAQRELMHATKAKLIVQLNRLPYQEVV